MKYAILVSILLIQFTVPRFQNFEEVDTEECDDIRSHVYDKIDPTFAKHKVSFCEKEIDNGMNFKMIMVNDDHPITSCDIVIWHDFHKRRFKVLKFKAPYRDCFALLRDHKEEEEQKAMEEDI